MGIKLSVYIATSLDGFIARPDGSLDWLVAENVPGEDYGYAEYMNTIDTLVIGRNTFEKVLTFGEWPYAGKRVVVLTRSLTENDVPKSLSKTVELHEGPAHQLVTFLEQTGSKHVYVDGGKVIRSFLSEGLIDEVTLTRIPKLIGFGIPLFGGTDRDINLRHVKTRTFENGFVQSTYRLARDV